MDMFQSLQPIRAKSTGPDAKSAIDGARRDAANEELTAADAGRASKTEDEQKGTREGVRPAGGEQPSVRDGGKMEKGEMMGGCVDGWKEVGCAELPACEVSRVLGCLVLWAESRQRDTEERQSDRHRGTEEIFRRVDIHYRLNTVRLIT